MEGLRSRRHLLELVRRIQFHEDRSRWCEETVAVLRYVADQQEEETENSKVESLHEAVQRLYARVDVPVSHTRADALALILSRVDRLAELVLIRVRGGAGSYCDEALCKERAEMAQMREGCKE